MHPVISGNVTCRYYFYAQPSGNTVNWYLIELVVTVATAEAKMQLKSDLSLDDISAKFKEALHQFLG